MASGLCVPHKQAAHMAAPTEGQNIKKALANGEPSTHGAKRTWVPRLGHRAFLDMRLDDRVGLAADGAVVVLPALLDLVDIVHAFDHLAPDRILLVEPGGVVEADEELAVGAVGISRARRRNRALGMLVVGEFGLEIG